MLYVSDLDGTLLNDNSEISELTKNLVNSLDQDYFVVATGRAYKVARQICKDINCDYIISFNGAIIYDCNQDQIIAKHPLTDWEKYAQELFDLGFNIYIYSEHTIYLMAHHFTGFKGYTKNNALVKLKAINSLKEVDETIYKIGCFVEEEQKDLAKTKFCEQGPFAFSLPYWMEYTNSATTKGKGILEFMQLKNIDKAETYVFGDGDNDISMFEIDGINKLAMANASDNLKALATEIIDSNQNDGVAKFIINLQKSKK